MAGFTGETPYEGQWVESTVPTTGELWTPLGAVTLTPATITSTNPVSGVSVGRSTPISFTVQHPKGIRRVRVDLAVGGKIGEEVAHNGLVFRAAFTGPANARVVVDDTNYQFTVLRDGGWTGTVTLLIQVFDVDGGVTDKTFTYPLIT